MRKNKNLFHLIFTCLTILLISIFLVPNITVLADDKSWYDPGMVPIEKNTWRDFIEPNLLPFTDDWSGGGAGGAYASDQGWHPSLIIMRVINIIYTLLAAVFLALMVFAGFSWMFAFGNKEKVSKALTIIRNAVIGLAVVIMAYAITMFIFHGLARATGV